MNDIDPSQAVMMSEDELDEALRRLREQARSASSDQLDQIQALRAAINRRLDLLLGLDMAEIDQDPKVRAATQRLAVLTVQVGAAVKEMRTATSAIQQATRVVGLADELLGLIGLIGPAAIL
jgi:hypothetical protein